MEEFITAGIEGQLLAILNRCRLALNDTYRSNISTVDGKAISLNALKGKKLDTIPIYMTTST